MVVQNQYIVNNTYYWLSSCIYLLLTKCVFRNVVQGAFQKCFNWKCIKMMFFSDFLFIFDICTSKGI